MTDKYIIFGAGNYGHRILNLIEKNTVDYFIDNDPLKDGLKIDGIRVNYFYNVRHLIQDHTIIVAVSRDKEEEIIRQLIANKCDSYIRYDDFVHEIIKNKILGRTNKIQIYKKTINWIKNNSIENEGIIVATSNRNSYPEVTGYYIPTLLRWGYRDLAVAYSRWLKKIQKEDGSWFDANNDNAYIFDSAQVLKGLLSIRHINHSVDDSIIKGCDWIFSRMNDEGRLLTPSKQAWGDDKDMCDEVVHLYCISPLMEAGRIFGRQDYVKNAEKVKKYYLTNYYDKIMKFSLLSHFYAYLMEALLDIGEVEMAKAAMDRMVYFQDVNGAIPAYNNVHWVCSTGLFQLALVWFRMGEYERGKNAFEYACKLQNESGGWYGSYQIDNIEGEQNDYFPDGEISWANKYFLDALYYKILKEFDANENYFLASIEKTDGRYKLIKEIAESSLKKGSKVLDIGCGKGRYIKNLLEDVPDRKYYASDVSEGVMKYIDDERVICKQGMLTCIPWDDNTFDFVYCCEALEHSIDIESAVREMARVTCPGGKIAIIDKPIEKLGALEIGEWEQWIDSKEFIPILKKYCSDVKVIDEIIYENNKNDGLFNAWIGTVA